MSISSVETINSDNHRKQCGCTIGSMTIQLIGLCSVHNPFYKQAREKTAFADLCKFLQKVMEFLLEAVYWCACVARRNDVQSNVDENHNMHRLYEVTHHLHTPLSGTTRVSRYQKGKTSLDFTEARDSEWQWYQLGHMQVCTSLQTDNHANTPPLFFTGRMPFLPPNQQRQRTDGRLYDVNTKY